MRLAAALQSSPSYRIDSGTSPDTLRRRRRLAEALVARGSDASPVDHWTQGAARLANAVSGNMELGRMEKAERENKQREEGQNSRLLDAMMGGASPQASSPPGGSYGERISGIESGGRYDALGPVTKTGDRAHGKYQVMGANIPEWSQAATGKPMTSEQYLADPKAQDAVFNHQFGQYVDKYGPEGAARAWFAGEKGMNDLNRKDQLGTSVAQYGAKFAGNPIPPEAQAQIRQLWASGPQGRALAMKVYQQYVKPPSPTKTMQDYDTARQQGYPGSFMDYQKDLRKSGATNVTVGGGKYGTIPPGHELVEGPEGVSMRVIPGSPAATKAEADKAKQESRQTAAAATAGRMMEDIDRAIYKLDQNPGMITGTLGAGMSYVPGSGADQFNKTLMGVKANIGFDRLQQMRESSPTGGALGNVTIGELERLESIFGSLANSQDPRDIKYNLMRLKNVFNETVHGKPEEGGPQPVDLSPLEYWKTKRPSGVIIEEER